MSEIIAHASIHGKQYGIEAHLVQDLNKSKKVPLLHTSRPNLAPSSQVCWSQMTWVTSYTLRGCQLLVRNSSTAIASVIGQIFRPVRLAK